MGCESFVEFFLETFEYLDLIDTDDTLNRLGFDVVNIKKIPIMTNE